LLDVKNADEINYQRLRWDFVGRQGRKIEHSGLCEVFLTPVEDADSSVIRAKGLCAESPACGKLVEWTKPYAEVVF